MPTNIEHYDLTGRRAVVVGANTPAGSAIAAALAEAGASVSSVDTTEDPVAAGAAVDRARDELGGLEIAVAFDKRLFAVHHTRAGFLAQFLDQGGGNFNHLKPLD